MLKLESHCRILEELVGSRLVEGKREACEVTLSDLGYTRYKVVVEPGEEEKVKVYVDVPCFEVVKPYLDCDDPKAIEPEPGYHLGYLCDEASDVEKMSYLRRDLLGAPFRRAFDALARGDTSKVEPLELPWRPTEAVYLVAGNDPANPNHWDRLIVVYAVDFEDESDAAMARVVLQQFAQTKVGNAPPCHFNEATKPPLEVSTNFSPREVGVGYLSFVLFQAHVATDARRLKALDLVVASVAPRKRGIRVSSSVLLIF
mmetsp:Transcript_35903/g.115044  ORF Transcript_35903/g.115044 Transcript_35903/m.115044 type:complete len:258 (-) Transcript_35903:477-1250(-)